jgi:hypothetical protein
VGALFLMATRNDGQLCLVVINKGAKNIREKVKVLSLFSHSPYSSRDRAWP